MPTLTQPTLSKHRPPPQGKRWIKDDASVGLFLVVSSSGHRSWMMRYRAPGGRGTKLTLGPVSLAAELKGDPVIGAPLTLRAARLLAADVLRQRALGTNVATACEHNLPHGIQSNQYYGFEHADWAGGCFR